MKKLISLILALVMVMGLAVGASAQIVAPTESAGSATITIENASKGVTYAVIKLFDATVTGAAEGGPIAYTGTIPASLGAFFTQDEAGNITVATGIDEDDLFEALAAWAEEQDAEDVECTDGSAMVFTDLAYGYYVVTTSQGEAAITVTSTNPNATIYDKNSTLPGNPVKHINGSEKSDVNIGDTVTYTVSFNTANYHGAGEEAKKISSYTIHDNLPTFLSSVEVTEVKVGETAIDLQQFDKNTNRIVIDWVDEEEKSKYDNGAVVTITYTAVIKENAAINGDGNTNTVTLTWNYVDDDTIGGNETATATAFTYDFLLMKTDGTDYLPGAGFKLYDEETGGNQIKVSKDTTGYYVDANGTEEIMVDSPDGVNIRGLAPGIYYLEETTVPDGYNKLTAREPVTITTGATEAVEVTVVNNSGSELPSTGGIGTTLFYVIGGLLMAGAAVVLITKKRMA